MSGDEGRQLLLKRQYCVVEHGRTRKAEFEAFRDTNIDARKHIQCGVKKSVLKATEEQDNITVGTRAPAAQVQPNGGARSEAAGGAQAVGAGKGEDGQTTANGVNVPLVPQKVVQIPQGPNLTLPKKTHRPWYGLLCKVIGSWLYLFPIRISVTLVHYTPMTMVTFGKHPCAFIPINPPMAVGWTARTRGTRGADVVDNYSP